LEAEREKREKYILPGHKNIPNPNRMVQMIFFSKHTDRNRNDDRPQAKAREKRTFLFLHSKSITKILHAELNETPHTSIGVIDIETMDRD